MEDLPREMILEIASFSDSISLFNLKFVSKRLYEILKHITFTARAVYKSWLSNPRRLGLDGYWLKQLAVFEMKARNIYYDRDRESYCDVNLLKPFRSIKRVNVYGCDERASLEIFDDPTNPGTIHFGYFDREIRIDDFIDLEILTFFRPGPRGCIDQEMIIADHNGVGFDFYDVKYITTYAGHGESDEDVYIRVKPIKDKIRRVDALIIYDIKKSPALHVLH